MSRKQVLTLIVSCFFFLPVSAHAVTHNVAIGDNFFSSNNLTITVGDTVRWTYDGGRVHDATADDGSWSSPTSSSIDFSRTFNSVEEVLYYCTVHSSPGRDISSNMNGRINVIAAALVPPTANFTSSCTDLACNFTDRSTDSDGTIASRSWDFGDGAMSNAQNPSHSYASAGTFPVGLTVTDNDGQEDSTSKNVTVTEPAGEPFLINSAMSDAWFFPDTAGQGFFIIIWESQKLIFLSWFTYDTERPPEDVTAFLGEPNHRWLTALGPYEGDTALLDVFLSSGMIFDSAEPPVDTVQMEGATIEIVWSDCKAGILKYDIPSLNLSGEIPIERIVEDNVPACEAAQSQ